MLYIEKMKANSIATLTVFLTAVMLVSLLITFNASTVLAPSSDPWWNPSWRYRVPIYITENSGKNLVNYTIKLIVDTQTPISQGKMRSDCGDIRFVSQDGSTKLPYWIESGINTPSTVIWVKIPLIPASGTIVIYMYYGNPSATSESDKNAVGIVSDDFEGWSPEDWILLGNAWIEHPAGSDYICLKTTPGTWGGLRSIAWFEDDIKIEMRVKYATPDRRGTFDLCFHWSDEWYGSYMAIRVEVKRCLCYFHEDHTIWFDGSSAHYYGDVGVFYPPFTGWMEITIHRRSPSIIEWWMDVYEGWRTVHVYRYMNYASQYHEGHIGFRIFIPSCSNNYLMIDYIRAYPYVSNPPTYTIGSEEELVDNTPPQIGDIELDPGSPTYEDTVVIQANITELGENDTGVETATLYYSVDGGVTWNNVDMTLVSGDEYNGIWEATIPSQPYGTQVQYYITATDYQGNSQTSSISSYTVGDSSPPEITSVSFFPSDPMPDEHVTVYAIVSEDSMASGVSEVTLYYSTDGGVSWDSIPMSLVSGDEYSGSWQAEIPALPSGTHVQFYVHAEDNAGNSADSAIYSYSVKCIYAGTTFIVKTMSGIPFPSLEVEVYSGSNMVANGITSRDGSVTLNVPMNEELTVKIKYAGYEIHEYGPIVVTSEGEVYEIILPYEIIAHYIHYTGSSSEGVSEVVSLLSMLLIAPIIVNRRRKGLQTWTAIVLATLIALMVSLVVYTWAVHVTHPRPSQSTYIAITDLSLNNGMIEAQVKNIGDLTESLRRIYIKQDKILIRQYSSSTPVLVIKDNQIYITELRFVDLRPNEVVTLVFPFNYTPGVFYNIKITGSMATVAEYGFYGE